jgi:hypothetical protein
MVIFDLEPKEMASVSVKEIEEVAKQIVRENPGGIRFATLCRAVLERRPTANRSTVYTRVFDLPKNFPDEITKPTRGQYVPVVKPGLPTTVKVIVPSESDFYQPFAEWLKNDLGEVTDAVVLGGASMGGKWGTPDVAGVYRKSAADLIEFPPEIVSAEIKTDPTQPVVAFGQGIAYRLFSTKTYIAMPASTTEVDFERLEALCMLFGVGLVRFTPDPKNPEFAIRARAQKFSPDMYYVNQFADRLKTVDPAKFKQLFG